MLISSDSEIYATEVTFAHVQLLADGPFELIVNGKLLKQEHRAKIVEIEVPIKKGANDFFLKLYQGTTAMKYCVSSPWNCI